MYQKELPAFIQLLSPKKEDVILDVGAGLGSIASFAASYSDEVFALEPNEKRADFIKSKYPEVKAFSGLAGQIPFPPSYFDKLYVIMAFHHFLDQGDVLEEFRRVTKKEGSILIHEIDPTKVSGKLLRFFETRIIHNKVSFLTPRNMSDLVAAHGFSIEKEQKARRGYFLLARNEKSSDESKGWLETSFEK